MEKKHPGKPCASHISADSITVTWSPVVPLDEDDFYQISFKEASSKRWKTLETEFKDHSAIVKNLNSNTKYVFRVRVAYADSEGPYSPESDECCTAASSASTTKHPGKPRVSHISADSITVTWSPAAPFDKDDYYQLSFKEVSTKRWKTLETEFNETSAEVKDLKSNTKYVFRVRVACADSEGPYSPESDECCTAVSQASRKKPPGKPRASHISADSITVTWSPAAPFDDDDFYELCYKEVSSKRWKTLETEFNENSAEVKDLKSNTKYVFRVRVAYVDSEGPYSSESDEYCTASKIKSPGKPCACHVSADSITVSWSPAAPFDENDYYQLSVKDVSTKRWKTLETEFIDDSAEVKDLKSNTKYVFRVRVAYADSEGPYSPESDEYCTAVSPATRIVQSLQSLGLGVKETGSPAKYQLPLKEIKGGRNDAAKTKKFEIGNPHIEVQTEKTIMLVGATGTGKSTLVDGFVNYVLGVNFTDAFRLTVINLEKEEKERLNNQALSQTEWITCYTLNPEQGSRLDYRLNIIDTPGFGDTRGLTQDQRIVDQIRTLFSSSGAQGVATLDAVCFLVKAPDARLTHIQKYIFDAIMALFGKDIEENIFYLVTFADGVDPPVLAALKESTLPSGEKFPFNNSGLFARNIDLDASSLSPMFWDMGLKSFAAFFAHLEYMKTRSLQMTKNVLDTRFRLEMTVKNIQPKIDVGFAMADQLAKEIAILETHKAEIRANANFTYEVNETVSVPKKKTPITYCTICCFTCHEPCAIEEESGKHGCWAMSGGSCRICPNSCHWSNHKSYVGPSLEYELVTKKVTKTYADMQSRYQKASGAIPSHEQLVEDMRKKLENLRGDIEQSMQIVKCCNEELKKIALRPNPLSMSDYIDLMIECEKREKKDKFIDRIKLLEEFRERAKISSKLGTGNALEPLNRNNIVDTLSRWKKWLFGS